MAEEPLRIGEVASRAGVSRRTVDFYTNQGLLTPVGQTEGRFRLYPPAAVERIVLIRRLEDAGFSLQDIARALQDSGAATASQTLDQANKEIRALRKALGAVPPAVGEETLGLLSVLADKIEALARTALELAGGTPPPF